VSQIVPPEFGLSLITQLKLDGHVLLGA